MAHAGTPTDLAKQPATSTSTSQGPWKALLAGIVVVTMAVGLVLATSFIAGANKANVAPADHSYDQIEAQRGAAGLSADHSHDYLDLERGGVTLSVPTGGSPYDTIENLRGNMRGAAPLPISTFDNRFDDVNNLKGNLR